MENPDVFPRDPVTHLPWSAELRANAAGWATTGEVHAVVLQVAGLNVLMDVFGYRAALSVLSQVARLLARQLDGRDLLGRHSGSAFLILTRRPYREIEALVAQIRARVFALSIETADGRIPEGRFGVAGMDATPEPGEAAAAIDALIIDAEIALEGTKRRSVPATSVPATAEEAAVPVDKSAEAVQTEPLVTEPAPGGPTAVEEHAAVSIGAPAPVTAVEAELEPTPVTAEPESALNIGGNEAQTPIEEAEKGAAEHPEGRLAPEESPGEEILPSRVTLVRCDVSDSGLTATVEVELSLGSRAFVGKVVGRNAPDRIPYLAGEATGRALTEVLPRGFGVVLQELRQVTQGEIRATWASVMLVSPDGEEKLLGIAPGPDDGHMGSAKAVLNAVNRRLSLILAHVS